MNYPFIIYLKNKTSPKFEYKRDVSNVIRTDTGYRITFNNGSSYNYRPDKVQYYPLLSTRKGVRIYENGRLQEKYDTVDNYGRYLVFRHENNCSFPVENNGNIEICDIKKNIAQAESVIEYFKDVLRNTEKVSFDIPTEETETKSLKQLSSDILLKALDEIDLLESRSALSHYLDGTNPAVDTSNKTFIYPFGCNDSQKLAVETSLRNSISIVEGPPGTGKTQTILNIIANLIVQNKTVAVVSNNNSAVFNVREKLEKYGYGMVVASLGNKNNKSSFFENISEHTVNPDFEISKERLRKAADEMFELDAVLTTCFRYRNRLATLKTELSDAEIEFSHLKKDQPLDLDIQLLLDKKFRRRWNFNRVLKLKNKLSVIDLEDNLSFMNKLRFVLQYGLFDFNSIGRYREEFPVYVNHKFYELYIAKIESEISKVDNWLASHNEESNLSRFIETSKELFNGALFERYRRLGEPTFKVDDYLDHFDDFIQYYPVILSSTLSLETSIQRGHLLDYLIIDESSQVDIIKAAVCFSCCRNAVVVGDSMQLTHIVDKKSQEVAEQFRKAYYISPAYDYVKQNILASLKGLHGDNVKSVLLKEHYRCHPAIIGFCNKKYYDNNLVVMTNGNNRPFRIIETNISGERDTTIKGKLMKPNSIFRKIMHLTIRKSALLHLIKTMRICCKSSFPKAPKPIPYINFRVERKR